MATKERNVDLAKLEAAELCIGQHWHGVYLTVHDFIGVLTWSNPYRTVVYGILVSVILQKRLVGLEVLAVSLVWGLHCVRDYNIRVARHRSTYKNMHSAYDFIVQCSAGLEAMCTSAQVMYTTVWAALALVAVGVCSRALTGHSIGGTVERFGPTLWLLLLGVTGVRRAIQWLNGESIAATDGAAEEDPAVAMLNAESNAAAAASQPRGVGAGAGEAVQAAPSITDEAIVLKALKLHTAKGWRHVQDANGVGIEEMVVDFCDKKAMRFTTVVNCSLSCFIGTVQSQACLRQFDPTLNVFQLLDPSSATGNRRALYTSYHQMTRLISPRDFVSTSACGKLSLDMIIQHGLAGNQDDPTRAPNVIWIQNSMSCNGKPVQKGYVRGVLYSYAYIVWCRPEEEEGPNARLQFACVSAVDPAGKIPGWVLDAARGDQAKKIAKIKEIAEERFVQGETS